MTTFGWDDQKAASNLLKHGVAFEEAQTVFKDPLARVEQDRDHVSDENREWIFGHSFRSRLLLVSYVKRGSALRIISARLASRHERKRYEEEIL